eukprot:scaffold2526_cov131-Cylindrotheca_fusiformis.AAC.14
MLNMIVLLGLLGSLIIDVAEPFEPFNSPGWLTIFVISFAQSLPADDIGLSEDWGDEGSDSVIPRGGLLLHAASRNKKNFPQFVQPLMVSIDDVHPHRLINDAWKQHIVEIQNKELPKKRRRTQRGGAKRSLAAKEDDSFVFGLESMLKKQDRKYSWPRLHVGEDDACALEYLHMHHNGNVEAAKMNVLVNMTAGQGIGLTHPSIKASKHLKCIEVKERKRRRLAPSCSSESWRKICERKGFKSILGLLKDEHQNPYAMREELAMTGLAFDDAMDLSNDLDDLKGAWRSVLAWGKSIEQQLDECTTKTKKLPFSSVVSFVSNAYRLPTPEICFGTHHVMVEEVSHCLRAILGHIGKAREVQAGIRDKMFNESADGIDSEALQKYVEAQCRPLSIRLDELDQVRRFNEVISEWEARLSSLLEERNPDEISEDHDDLAIAQRMAVEAKSHGYVSKGLVHLNLRIQKARNLKDRILQWKSDCTEGKKCTPRTVAALARDAKRLNFVFPVSREFLKFHGGVEVWIDRANIAIRSKISLAEIKTLIRQGESLPLDMIEYLEKLRTRVSAADRWLGRLAHIVRCPNTASDNIDMLQWSKHMRAALYGGNQSCLHELASDGNRIPVDVDAVKLLQVELDAKNWSSKAQKWLPGKEDSKKGKLVDIREHVERAQCLRERLPLSLADKSLWVLDGEAELVSIVSAADAWFEEHKLYLEGDNRRNQCRSCLSLAKLRTIVEAERRIFANLGNAASKISRILAQSENWYKKYKSLLVKCNLEPLGGTDDQTRVELSEMEEAVESAEAEISLDLEEAVALKRLVEKTRKWFDRVAIVAPSRSRRQSRIGRSIFTVDDLIELIDESSGIPVEVESDVERLRMQLNAIQTWRLNTSHELQRIAYGFVELRESMTSAYGLPSEFRLDRFSKLAGWDGQGHGPEDESGRDFETVELEDQPLKTTGSVDMVSSAALSSDTAAFIASGREEKGGSDVHRMIRDLRDSAKRNGVMTVEAEIADLLERVSRWCLRSLKYLNSPREVYDKRFFGAFDRFLGEGNELVEKYESNQKESERTSYESLASSWSGMVVDQLERLRVLRSDRAKFIQWCEVANKMLSDEKKLTIEKLKDLAEKSRCFPAVRGLALKVATWVDEARKLYTSGKKLSLQDAKALLEGGEKLKVNTQELRTLRSSLRAVRTWTNKVKRCNLEQGEIHISAVNDLIEEHKSFLIEMPDELSILEQATQAYCICRRPYEGFMIGCDDCDEWYHGSCIGVSESRADRYDKFTCVRCSTKNVFRNSAAGALEIIKKWTSSKHLKKSRQIEYQKHQRKVRKETKDIEKSRAILKSLEEVARNQDVLLPNDKSLDHTNTSHPQVDESVRATSSTDNEGIALLGRIGAELPASLDTAEGTSDTCSIVVRDLSCLKVDCCADTQAEKERAESAIHQAEERLRVLSQKNEDRKQLEKEEDMATSKLRGWCIRVRSLILVPSSKAQCVKSCPSLDGSLSPCMLSLLSEAESLGISSLPDVESMANFFRCMSWSLQTLSIINRNPSFDEMTMLISKASSLKLPDEKAIKTMRVMHQRAIQWRGKIQRALAPRPGETKAINLSFLKELSAGIGRIALHIPEACSLNAAIKDRGARHCLCGGPSDGSVMVVCSKCKRKFHGSCIEKIESNRNVENWECRGCTGQEYQQANLQLYEKSFSGSRESKSHNFSIRGISPHAPDPQQLWPPFPLFGSPEATELLGPDCSQIPDDVGILEPAQITEEEIQKPRETSAGIPPPTSLIGTAPKETPIRTFLFSSSPTEGLCATKPLIEVVAPVTRVAVAPKTTNEQKRSNPGSSNSVEADVVVPTREVGIASSVCNVRFVESSSTRFSDVCVANETKSETQASGEVKFRKDSSDTAMEESAQTMPSVAPIGSKNDGVELTKPQSGSKAIDGGEAEHSTT